MVEIRQGVGSG
nr:unnamed protein product [Callosobruchus chinensis]CAH7736682.1 unnamed protein product [Callosobruchus chinensis]